MSNNSIPASNTETESDKVKNRREALKNLGKYSAYIAPFTVMAMSSKAASASGGSGKSKHSASK